MRNNRAVWLQYGPLEGKRNTIPKEATKTRRKKGGTTGDGVVPYDATWRAKSMWKFTGSMDYTVTGRYNMGVRKKYILKTLGINGRWMRIYQLKTCL